MRSIRLPDGARLATYVDGPAKASVTALLVHGLSVTAALWRSHVPLLLREGMRVVRYDQRGHGYSTRGTAALSLDQLADDLAQVLEPTAPRGPLVLAGHSMGAMTLMRLVARHPHLAPRICGLVLISPPYGGISTRTGTGPAQSLLTLGRNLLESACTHAPYLLDAVRRRLPTTSRWALHSPAQPTSGALPLPCRQGLHTMATGDIAALWHNLANQQPDPSPLQQLGGRVHLLAGSLDAHIPPEQTGRLAACLPGAQLETVPDTTHALPLRHAQLVTDRISRCASHRSSLTDLPEPHHPMPPLNLAEQAEQLRDLAREFEALHARVRDLSYTPGTDALRRISPLLLKVQDLMATAVVRLGALDGGAYADIAGSRASLECLASVVVASSLAGNDLASALYANPYEGAPFAGYPTDDEAVRTARHAEAIPRMTGHLADAAHQLDLSAIGCHYVATGITRDLAAAQEQAKPVQRTTGPTTAPSASRTSPVRR